VVDIYLLRRCRHFLAGAQRETVLLQDTDDVVSTLFYVACGDRCVDGDELRVAVGVWDCDEFCVLVNGIGGGCGCKCVL
jgi:hypothetical protein